MFLAPPFTKVTFGRVITSSAYAEPVALPMIDFFGHAPGPERLTLLWAHLGYLPPLKTPPFEIRMSKAVTIGGSMPASLSQRILPESFTPCGCRGVPALLGVTLASTVIVVTGACATDGATRMAPNATPATMATSLRINLSYFGSWKSSQDGASTVRALHGTEACRGMQT